MWDEVFCLSGNKNCERVWKRGKEPKKKNTKSLTTIYCGQRVVGWKLWETKEEWKLEVFLQALVERLFLLFLFCLVFLVWTWSQSHKNKNQNTSRWSDCWLVVCGWWFGMWGVTIRTDCYFVVGELLLLLVLLLVWFFFLLVKRGKELRAGVAVGGVFFLKTSPSPVEVRDFSFVSCWGKWDTHPRFVT